MLMTAVYKLFIQLVVVVSWIIELRNRFPWYDKTPPSSLGFKLLFLVTGQFYDMNRRVSNPCFSSCFREFIAIIIMVLELIELNLYNFLYYYLLLSLGFIN
jgi:hypothetical protein